MLQIFRTNQRVIHVLVLVYLSILWAPSFITGLETPKEGAGYIAIWLWSILPLSSTIYLIVALVLVWVQGLILNHLVLEYRMGPYATLFPGLFLAWFYSATPEFIGLYPVLIANTFIALALHQFYAIYKNQSPALQVFNSGFLLSLASLSFFPAIALIPAGWVVLGILRGNRLDQILQYLIGALLPWFFLFLIYFWVEPTGTFIDLAGIYLGWPPLFLGPDGIRIWVQGLFILIVILFMVSRVKLLGLGETIQVHKYLNIGYIFLLTGAMSLLLTDHIFFNHYLIIAIPLGLLGGLWLARMPPRWSESAHFLLLAGALLYQYFPLL